MLLRVHNFVVNLKEEVPIHSQFEIGGTILLGQFGRRLVEFFLIMSKTMLDFVCSFILWFMLYLEGWSLRTSYYNGVALKQSLRHQWWNISMRKIG